MLGRPLRIDPLFMKAWAGSWLICSVCIERTTAISSAIPAMCGKRSEISWPDWPCRRKSTNEPRALSVAPCNWASCWPFVNDSGNGWPSSRFNSGLGSKLSNCEGPPAMQRWITRFALGRDVQRVDHPLDPAGGVRGEGLRPQEVGQRQAAQPVGRLAEEGPAAQPSAIGLGVDRSRHGINTA